MIGKTIATQVTSVLQTTAGKMIFGRFPEETEMSAGVQQVRPDRRPVEKQAIANNRVSGTEDERLRGK